METVCKKNKCTGCMACVETCIHGAIAIKDNLSEYNAFIDSKKCVNCNMCHKICPNNTKVETKEPIAWYQGWAKNKNIRGNSSSGGLATAISKSFVKRNGVVYSCCFKNGSFLFERAESEQDIRKFIGSKYVKSNPYGVYKAIKNDLKLNEQVLFIGLPCQCAALRNYIGDRNNKNLYLIDLICHGTPSPKLLNIFLNQYGKSLYSIKNISFRVKAKMQIHCDNKGIVTKGVSDKYTIAFLNGLTYTENCYNCDYAKRERVSDLTLGDSWGSEIMLEERKKGISLVLCQTNKGKELLTCSEVEIVDVDSDNAIKNNLQLQRPFRMPKSRDKFFRAIQNERKFNKEVYRYYTKQCIKQDLKELLIRVHILRSDDNE